jgi:hypothetical protein
MKKRYLISGSLIMISVLSACSGSKETRTTTRSIRGNWALQTIVMEGSGKPRDKIFNEAAFSCFIGSEWKFAKNGIGSYMLVDKEKTCPEIKRLFSWTYIPAEVTPGTVQLKRINEKNEPMDGETFTLVITQLDNSNMKLRVEQLTDVNSAAMIYNFVRH